MDELAHRILGTKEVAANVDLYVLIDFLNRTLKEKEVIFGLAKAKEEGKFIVTVYRTD